MATSTRQLEFNFGPSYAARLRTTKIILYRLKDPASVPPLLRTCNGKLVLEQISADPAWRLVANACQLPTEDALFREEMESRRQASHQRTDHFVQAVDAMAREGLGVYLHPSYYDEQGRLVPERLNDFYVFVGFERLRNSQCQAADVVTLCRELGLPLLMFTPGELLSAGERQPGESYFRAVSLDEAGKMDEVIRTIRAIAIHLVRNAPPPYVSHQSQPPPAF